MSAANVDINRLLNSVCGGIQNARKKELEFNEVSYVMAKLRSLDPSIFIGRKLADVVPIMVKIYSDDLKKMEKTKAIETDLHEYQVNAISQEN